MDITINDVVRKGRREREIVEQGFGYRIYLKDGIFFLETSSRLPSHGFYTLASARESAYYQGLREYKD